MIDHTRQECNRIALHPATAEAVRALVAVEVAASAGALPGIIAGLARHCEVMMGAAARLELLGDALELRVRVLEAEVAGLRALVQGAPRAPTVGPPIMPPSG